MKLYFDTNKRILLAGQRTSLPLEMIQATRRDVLPVEILFISNGRVVELSEPVSLTIGVKESGGYSGKFVAVSSDHQKTGVGETARYTMSLDLSSVELGQLFDSNQEYIDLAFEIEAGTESFVMTAASTIRVKNDFIQGEENTLPSFGHSAPTLILNSRPLNEIEGLPEGVVPHIIVDGILTDGASPTPNPVVFGVLSAADPNWNGKILYYNGETMDALGYNGDRWELNNPSTGASWIGDDGDYDSPIDVEFWGPENSETGTPELTPSDYTNGILGQIAFVVEEGTIIEKWLCISETPVTWERQMLGMPT